MNLFSFDKFWGLDWTKTEDNIYSSSYEKFIVAVDKTRASRPVFSIHANEATWTDCLVDELDSDMFILQLKSIKETGKIAIK